jgi:hypothetical protein
MTGCEDRLGQLIDTVPKVGEKVQARMADVRRQLGDLHAELRDLMDERERIRKLPTAERRAAMADIRVRLDALNARIATATDGWTELETEATHYLEMQALADDWADRSDCVPEDLRAAVQVQATRAAIGDELMDELARRDAWWRR